MSWKSKIYKPYEEEDVNDIEIVPGVEELTLNAQSLADAYGKASCEFLQLLSTSSGTRG
jgi:hypothetical protein